MVDTGNTIGDQSASCKKRLECGVASDIHRGGTQRKARQRIFHARAVQLVLQVGRGGGEDLPAFVGVGSRYIGVAFSVAARNRAIMSLSIVSRFGDVDQLVVRGQPLLPRR